MRPLKADRKSPTRPRPYKTDKIRRWRRRPDRPTRVLDTLVVHKYADGDQAITQNRDLWLMMKSCTTYVHKGRRLMRHMALWQWLMHTTVGHLNHFLRYEYGRKSRVAHVRTYVFHEGPVFTSWVPHRPIFNKSSTPDWSGLFSK